MLLEQWTDHFCKINCSLEFLDMNPIFSDPVPLAELANLSWSIFVKLCCSCYRKANFAYSISLGGLLSRTGSRWLLLLMLLFFLGKKRNYVSSTIEWFLSFYKSGMLLYSMPRNQKDLKYETKNSILSAVQTRHKTSEK